MKTAIVNFIVKAKMIWDVIRLPYIMLRLTLNPMNIEPIFSLGTFRNHKSFQIAHDKVMSDPGMRAMVESRYLAGPEDVQLDKLAQMPEGTLGREFFRFVDERKLDVNFYQLRKEIIYDDHVYARRRGPQTHDLWHAVVGVDITPEGEMKLSAVYVAQVRSPLNCLFLGLGLFHTLFLKPEKLETYFDAVTEGWTIGRKAKPLFAMKWEEMWERPLADIRMELNLPLVSSGVAKTVSVLPGVNQKYATQIHSENSQTQMG